MQASVSDLGMAVMDRHFVPEAMACYGASAAWWNMNVSHSENQVIKY